MESNMEKPAETTTPPVEAVKPEAAKPAEAPKVETGRKPKTTYGGGNNKFNKFNKKPSGPPQKRF